MPVRPDRNCHALPDAQGTRRPLLSAVIVHRAVQAAQRNPCHQQRTEQARGHRHESQTKQLGQGAGQGASDARSGDIGRTPQAQHPTTIALINLLLQQLLQADTAEHPGKSNDTGEQQSLTKRYTQSEHGHRLAQQQRREPGRAPDLGGAGAAAGGRVSWEAGGDSDADGVTLLSVMDTSPARTSLLHTYLYGWIPHPVQAHSKLRPAVA